MLQNGDGSMWQSVMRHVDVNLAVKENSKAEKTLGSIQITPTAYTIALNAIKAGFLPRASAHQPNKEARIDQQAENATTRCSA